LLTCLPITATAAPAKKLAAITFDDGPSNYTATLLDGLKELGAKATFFMQGWRAEMFPSTVRRVYEEGHQIASHTYDHPELTSLSNEKIKEQLQKTDKILDGHLGMDFDYMLRPPYGSTNDRVRSVIGVPSVQWTVDPMDWDVLNAQIVCDRIVRDTFDGAIILVHDLYNPSVRGALMAMEILQERGYEFVTVQELYRRRGVSMRNGAEHYSCKPTGVDYGPVETPVITVNGGYGGKVVSMTAQSGAKIYYTTDGSDPIFHGKLYTGSFPVEHDMTVKAVAAFNLNGSRSAVVSQTMDTFVAAPPVLTVSDGMIRLDNPNEGTDIRYTVDGTSVTADSLLYVDGIAFFDGELRYRVMGVGVHSTEERIYVTSDGNLYRDVPTAEWYADEINRSVNLGLFKGVGDYKFEPETSLTRAMFVTLLYRLAGLKGADVSYETPADFADATAAWYADSLSWGQEKGIVKGYGDGNFLPDHAISREEMCVMLARTLTVLGAELPEGELTFTDSTSVADWALEAVAGMSALGIVQGYEDNTFRPAGTALRAHAAALLLRTYEYVD
jgi:peptidoglycan/xylan/chitin deacetylase (PgdA/CDA1 family)